MTLQLVFHALIVWYRRTHQSQISTDLSSWISNREMIGNNNNKHQHEALVSVPPLLVLLHLNSFVARSFAKQFRCFVAFRAASSDPTCRRRAIGPVVVLIVVATASRLVS